MTLKLKVVNILMGDQGTEKSAVAKLLMANDIQFEVTPPIVNF